MAVLEKSRLFSSGKMDTRIQSANVQNSERWLGFFAGPGIIYITYYVADKEKNPRDEGLVAEGLNKLELKGRKVKMEFMAELVKQGDEIKQYILVEENDKGATVMYIYPNK